MSYELITRKYVKAKHGAISKIVVSASDRCSESRKLSLRYSQAGLPTMQPVLHPVIAYALSCPGSTPRRIAHDKPHECIDLITNRDRPTYFQVMQVSGWTTVVAMQHPRGSSCQWKVAETRCSILPTKGSSSVQ